MCIGYDPFKWADSDLWTEEDEREEFMKKVTIDLEAITQEMDGLKDSKARLEFELKKTKQRIEVLELQLTALLNQQGVNEFNYGVYRIRK